MPAGIGVDVRRAARVAGAVVFMTVALASVHVRAQHVPVSPLPDSVDPGAHAPARDPAGPLLLEDAVALALRHHPDLAASAWETRARTSNVLQAGRRPNPTVSVLAEDIGASRPTSGTSLGSFAQPQVTVEIGQRLELGGKRRARVALAARNRDLARWDDQTVRAEVVGEVRRRFADVLIAQDTVDLVDETTRIVEQTHGSVRARVEAGVVSPIEETRAAVTLAAMRVESASARRSLHASRTRLALLWGNVVASFGKVIGEDDAVIAPLPAFDDLVALLDRSPRLARWSDEIAQREAALAVEQARRVPDVTLVGGYRRFTDLDNHAFVVGAAVPLPLFNRNRDGIEEARSRAAKALDQSRAARLAITAQLAEAYADLARAHDAVTIIRTEILPGSREAFDAVGEGYRLGKFGYLDVLDAQRTLVDAGGQQLRALADYYRALAEVERLTAPFSALPIGAPTTKE